MITRTEQKLELTVCQDRGDIGVAVCIAKPPSGMNINSEAVQTALEHVHSASDVIYETQVGLSFIACVIPLPEDDEGVNEHVLAIMHCMIAGVEDYLAESGEELLAPSMSAFERERELIDSLSD